MIHVSMDAQPLILSCQRVNMKDRILWLIFALIPFGLLYPITYSAYSEWTVDRNGKIVVVTITSLPNAHSLGNFMGFKMGDHLYDKRLNNGSYNAFHVGERIRLKYLKGYEHFFLFPGEYSAYKAILAILVVVALGCGCLYYGLKKNPPHMRFSFGRKRAVRTV